MQIMIESFETLHKNNETINADFYTLILTGLVTITSTYVKQTFYTHESEVYQRMHFNQSKWTEVLIDFLLNIKENKVTTKSEFLTTFSYTKVLSAEALQFLFEIMNRTGVHFFFLATVQPSCIQLKIASYLLQYLHSTQS